MRPSNLSAILFLLTGSLLPAAVSAQQTDTTPRANQPQTQSSSPVQPERTPQQSDQVRKQDNRSTEETRINRDWTTQRGDDRMDMDRMRQRHMGRMMEQDENRTVGRNWRRDDDDMDRGPRYGDRSGRDYNEPRSRRRVKTCIEFENGDEYCRYRD